DREVPCRCSASMVERYRSKLRGPLADRIDLMIDVTRPDPQVIIEGAEGMSSAELRDYVVRGRAFRAWRESRLDDADAEAEDDESRSIDGVVSTFALDGAAEKCVLGLSRRTHLTGRGIVRLVRIARTIADVAESERVTQDHVLEAAMYQGRRDQ
ncbi:MAG: ATP-binding protein, partial [Collinsella sp.]